MGRPEPRSVRRRGRSNAFPVRRHAGVWVDPLVVAEAAQWDRSLAPDARCFGSFVTDRSTERADETSASRDRSRCPTRIACQFGSVGVDEPLHPKANRFCIRRVPAASQERPIPLLVGANPSVAEQGTHEGRSGCICVLFHGDVLVQHAGPVDPPGDCSKHVDSIYKQVSDSRPVSVELTRVLKFVPQKSCSDLGGVRSGQMATRWRPRTSGTLREANQALRSRQAPSLGIDHRVRNPGCGLVPIR